MPMSVLLMFVLVNALKITLKVLIIVFCVCVLSIIRPTYSSQINFRFTATAAAPTVEDYLAVYVHFASYVKYFTLHTVSLEMTQLQTESSLQLYASVSLNIEESGQVENKRNCHRPKNLPVADAQYLKVMSLPNRKDPTEDLRDAPPTHPSAVLPTVD